MYCTRWFIPLFLLPVPVTRPYFLVLFTFSALFHARPCAYCVAVLIGLFVTGCYWSPVEPSTLDSTALEALNSTELKATMQMSSIALLSRCWCDFQKSPFFGYYNVTEWEIDSVKQALAASNFTAALEEEQKADSTNSTQEPTTNPSSGVWRWIGRLKNFDTSLPWRPSHEDVQNEDGQTADLLTQTATAEDNTAEKLSQQTQSLPWLRWKYDLRPYGVDLIVDLGWRRS